MRSSSVRRSISAWFASSRSRSCSSVDRQPVGDRRQQAGLVVGEAGRSRPTSRSMPIWRSSLPQREVGDRRRVGARRWPARRTARSSVRAAPGRPAPRRPARPARAERRLGLPDGHERRRAGRRRRLERAITTPSRPNSVSEPLGHGRAGPPPESAPPSARLSSYSRVAVRACRLACSRRARSRAARLLVTAATARKISSASHSSRVADREGVARLDEEEVVGQEREDGGAERAPPAPGDGAEHHDQQVEDREVRDVDPGLDQADRDRDPDDTGDHPGDLDRARFGETLHTRSVARQKVTFGKSRRASPNP